MALLAMVAVAGSVGTGVAATAGPGRPVDRASARALPWSAPLSSFPLTGEPLRLPLSTTRRSASAGGVSPARLRQLPTETVHDIPPVVLDAYRRAARGAQAADPGCHVSWADLAGIGFIESDNARPGGSAARGWRGTASPRILGPVLDGPPYGAVPDTDRGRWDGDTRWDRAVGPMQFIPSTWVRYARDANHDHSADPQDVYDATDAAARYLCAVGTDLATPDGLVAAIFAYNHSLAYVQAVLETVLRYTDGSGPVAVTASAALSAVDAAIVAANAKASPAVRHRRRQPASPSRAAAAAPKPTPSLTPSTPAPAPVPTDSPWVSPTGTASASPSASSPTPSSPAPSTSSTPAPSASSVSSPTPDPSGSVSPTA